jgi:hypothetical protein
MGWRGFGFFHHSRSVFCRAVPNPNLTIRDFFPSPHAGVSVGLKKVEEAMRNLNVQLDNLCQFLPQDRVVAFAQLKPTELLLETEKAIGDSALLKMHMELIAHRNDIKGLETVRPRAVWDVFLCSRCTWSSSRTATTSRGWRRCCWDVFLCYRPGLCQCRQLDNI